MKFFRVAAEAPTWRHVATTFVQAMFMWSVFLGLLPWLVLQAENGLALPRLDVPHHRPIGGAIFLGASLLGLTTGFTMAVRGRGTPLPLCTARLLVAVGPYRLVRNPMAVAGIAQGLAVGIFLDSWLVALYALSGAVLWHSFVRPSEERDLEQRFAAEFVSYRNRVPLWLPRVASRSTERRLAQLLVLAMFATWIIASNDPRDVVRLIPTTALTMLIVYVLVRR